MKEGFNYTYQYKDLPMAIGMGNIRLSCKDLNQNIGAIDLEIIEENNYYPFGLTHKRYNEGQTENGNSLAQAYKFGGKELSQELNLATYDFGARNYDAALGRWMNIDPLAEKYLTLSSYASFANNPMIFSDPNGSEILFWQINSEGHWEQVKYENLNKFTKDAIDKFGQTKAGKEFLSLFAKKDEKIGDLVFESDGKYSKHNFNIKTFEQTGGDLGKNQPPIQNIFEGPSQMGVVNGNIDFNVLINLFRDDYSSLSFTETLGHEVFQHLIKYMDEYIKAFEQGNEIGATLLFGNYHQYTQGGHLDHISAYKNPIKFKEYFNFTSQLKTISNPKEVDKLVNDRILYNYKYSKKHLKL